MKGMSEGERAPGKIPLRQSDMNTIVLFENSELKRLLKESFFHREGVVLVSVNSGRQLFQTLDINSPDMIILNTELSDMSGAACCLALKADKRYRSIPVVMVLPSTRPHELDLARQAGCNAVLLAPIVRDDLVAMTRAFIPIRERVASRHPIRLEVRYGVDPHQLKSGSMANLNHLGFFLECEDSFPKDTLITAEFTLPGTHRRIKCSARVAWISNTHIGKTRSLINGSGLQFINLQLQDREFIQDFFSKS
jgi:CheY-like chemotaxis protein/Tfp pilus assembly protein PilZ